MRRTILLMIASVLLLIVGSTVLANGVSAPKSTEEEVTRLSYELKGEFDHRAYSQSIKLEPNAKFFLKITDSIIVYYRYQFLSEEPVSRVTEQVEISAVVTMPGLWEKEVPLVPLAEMTGDVSISFPLNTADFMGLAANISEEIGVGGTVPIVILKATVHTVAETQYGVLENEFIQTSRLILGGNIIEWGQPLALSRKGYREGLIYEQKGNFGYAVQLKPNILFGETTLRSTLPAAQPPAKLPHSLSYRPDTVQTIEASFSYQVDSDGPLSQIENEVEITAVLSKAGGEGMLFSLLPKRQLTGESFDLTVPLDIDLFYNIVEDAEKEREGPIPDYQLMVKADVHTVAQSEFGIIDKFSSPTVALTLEQNNLLWPSETEKTESGSITETVVTPNPDKGRTIIAGLGILGMMIAVSLYTVWSYRLAKARRARLPVIDEWATAVRLEEKHRDIIVEVEALPPDKLGTLIPIDSLGELVKVADALLKPVLHKAERDIHIYYVIDGLTRYKYVGLEAPE